MLKSIARTISKKLKLKKDLKNFKNIPKIKKSEDKNRRNNYKRVENTFKQAASTYQFFLGNSDETLNISSHLYKGTELKIVGTNNLNYNSGFDLIEYFEETKATNFILNLEFADFQSGFLIRR